VSAELSTEPCVESVFDRLEVLLPQVSKPIQYVGGELNSQVKDWNVAGPETVRWAAQRGAEVVFHPHFHEAEAGGYRPSTFADPANTFHEKAALCRAAENTCFFATVNYASEGSPTTSAVVKPDGTVLTYQPYGRSGLLLADIDRREATRLLASRYKPA